MRVTRIEIDHWRNFRHISLAIPPDATLVCLVGENGTGKSNLLELLSAAAVQLGVSAGIESPRGNPLDEAHLFEVEVQLPEDAADLIDPARWPHFAVLAPKWTRRLTYKSERTTDGTWTQALIPGGMERSALTDGLVSHVVQQLRAREETQHLYLDADRAYPPFQVQPHQFAELISQPWESPEWTKQWAFRSTRTLYEEWIKFFLAQESRSATRLLSEIRRAREAGEPDPKFEDHFSDYRNSVAEVLPHLKFMGVETQSPTRTLLFDTAGTELSFAKLSGGEREIAFLIGQVERFKLRRGLLLIDEPELHLNPDLLRTWLAFLRDTVQEGQVWIATHSLEAVEVAGHGSTFVMERTGDTRIVESITPLSDRPVVSALSVAVGAPAFSISGLRFILVEGARETRERERFYQVCGEPTVNRFLEGGGCQEVARKLRAVTELARETDEQLRVGGVVDRDFRTSAQLDEITSISPVYVLGCHEIENLFLHPEASSILLKRLGLDPAESQTLLQRASDSFAGIWICQRVSMMRPDLPRPTREMRKVAGSLTWSDFDSDESASVSRLIIVLDLAGSQLGAWETELHESTSKYRSVRESPELWAECLGKQVLSRLPRDVGLSDAAAMERQVVQIWDSGEAARPTAAMQLIEYVQSLSQ